MNYLIIYKKESFYTNWYDFENNYQKGMIVINLLLDQISFDGITFHEIIQDHL